MRGDPSQPQSWNRYAYASDNPLLYIDPSGMAPCPYTGPDGLPYEGECIDVEADANEYTAWDTTQEYVDLMAFDVAKPILNVWAGLYNDDPGQIALGYGQQALAAVPGGIRTGLRPLAGQATRIIAEPVAIGGSEALAGAQLVSPYKLNAFHTFSQSVLGFADDAVVYRVTNVNGGRELLVRIPGGLGPMALS